MTDPTFLDLEGALHIHAEQLARHGGSAGLRDLSLLTDADRGREAGPCSRMPERYPSSAACDNECLARGER